MLRIKKDDQVMVVVGKDKGKTGKVLKVFPKEHRLRVENINVVKKAQRPTQQNQQGGMVDIEVPIHISNVMLIDKKSNKPTRLGVSVLKDGLRVRMSKKSSEVI